MFSRHLSWVAAAAATLTCQPFVSAQFYNDGCSSCGTSAPAPMATVSSCTPIQPVYSSCYQTVPVTTYKREKQTVRVPVYRTVSEEREVTEYQPVERRRTVKVPTVSYKTVYENRTVQKDLGRWQTNYHPVAKCAPCQVDPRPGLMGWLNRTGYAFQSAFVPNYRTSRQYVPNKVACNVQVPRQVAVRGEREVEQRWTEMVPRTRTVKVDVQKLAWKEEEVTVSRPVTAYRTVPVGSSLAYGYGGYGTTMAYGYGGYGFSGSTMAFIDDEDSTRTARRPEPDPGFEEDDDLRRKRSAETFREDAPTTRSSDASERNSFQRTSSTRTLPADGHDLKPAFPDETPGSAQPSDKPSFQDFQSSRERTRSDRSRSEYRAPAFAGGWKSRRSSDGPGLQNDVRTADHRLTIPRLTMNDGR